MTFLLITAATATAALATLALFALQPDERHIPVRIRDDETGPPRR